MGANLYGEVFTTSDWSTTPRVFQPVSFTANTILIAARSWFIFYNDPAFTNLTMEVWTNNAGEPGVLLATSTNTWTKAELITEDHGFKEIYFKFDQLNMRAGDTYHFCPKLSGYTGTTSTHVAWKKAFPDPVLSSGLTVTFESLGGSPYAIYFIGGEL